MKSSLKLHCKTKNENFFYNKVEDILKLLTKKECAKILDISLPTLSKYIKLKKIKCIHLGGRQMFRREDIMLFIKNCESPAFIK